MNIYIFLIRSLLISLVFFHGSIYSNDLMQEKIEHVVVLMLENRSFDNFLAWAYDGDTPERFIPAQSDPHYKGLTEENLSLYTNVLKNSKGNIVLVSPPIKGVPSIEGRSFIDSPLNDPHESFPHVISQIYGDSKDTPTMTGFLQDYASFWNEKEWLQSNAALLSCMETYTENELPIFYGLAKHYAISDEWFCSVPTMTNPNRAFMACGTSQGQTVNGPLGKSQFTADTIWNRLEEVSKESALDLSWKIFWQGDMLPGIFSGPITGTNTFLKMGEIDNLQTHYHKMDTFHALARSGQLPRFSFIEPQFTTAMPIKASIFKGKRPIGVLGNDYHPPVDVRAAENLLANIYTSLIANREAFEKTLLVITFDEHGGLFDHVPPPFAQPPDDNSQNGFSFDRYGVRVPTLFISPLVEKKCIVRSGDPNYPFDHTSLIATILDWLHIDKSRWNLGKRTAIAPTFQSVITLNKAREDLVIGQKKSARISKGKALQMGEPFFLKDPFGNYLVKSKLFSTIARAGVKAEKMPLVFTADPSITNQVSTVTHGSFALIQAMGEDLGDKNFLSTFFFNAECFYEKISHKPHQWWTIKSVDHPNLGEEICFGDKIYLENHMFQDPFQQVPGRLVKQGFPLKSLLKTTPVTDANSASHYWIIEPMTAKF